MKQYEECLCSCSECVSMCEKRPCWPTPQESKKLIEQGFAKKLMLDYWADQKNIYIICPAIEGYEGSLVPFIPVGKCSLLKDSLCILHDLKLKPVEARIASCETSYPDLHRDVAMLWKSDEGRNVVELWKKECEYKD